jgi:hypothetical protein
MQCEICNMIMQQRTSISALNEHQKQFRSIYKTMNLETVRNTHISQECWHMCYTFYVTATYYMNTDLCFVSSATRNTAYTTQYHWVYRPELQIPRKRVILIHYRQNPLHSTRTYDVFFYFDTISKQNDCNYWIILEIHLLHSRDGRHTSLLSFNNEIPF